VITFWPRPFHPFAVRPYAERAVPELREFVLHGPRPSPLVITAHSQGSIVALAAVQPVLEDLPPGTALVTFGSPLRDLYARFFPRSFDRPSIDAVGHRLGARWRNLFRYTDHVGRAVFADDGEVLRRFGDALPAELIGLADRPIVDPSPTDRMLEGHNRYWSCAEVRAAVEDLTDA
jgi:hypothetical protein